jgi:hypothetical protein
MEPSELNSPSNDDAQLAALLRNITPPLRDLGFSSNVVAALPPPRPTWHLSRRTVALGAGAAAGFGLVIWQGLGLPDAQSEIARVAGALSGVNPHFSSVHVWTAIAVMFGSLIVAFCSELRDKLVPWIGTMFAWKTPL